MNRSRRRGAEAAGVQESLLRKILTTVFVEAQQVHQPMKNEDYEIFEPIDQLGESWGHKTLLK